MRSYWLRVGPALACAAMLLVAADTAFGQRGRRLRDDAAPQVGDKAPLFKLKMLKGKKSVDLARVIKNKPVVLFFGSYT